MTGFSRWGKSPLYRRFSQNSATQTGVCHGEYTANLPDDRRMVKSWNKSGIKMEGYPDEWNRAI
jgi:hypothetical protein